MLSVFATWQEPVVSFQFCHLTVDCYHWNPSFFWRCINAPSVNTEFLHRLKWPGSYCLQLIPLEWLIYIIRELLLQSLMSTVCIIISDEQPFFCPCQSVTTSLYQNKPWPAPSRITDIKTNGTESLVLADTDERRKQFDNKAVKKTSSIPHGLTRKQKGLISAQYYRMYLRTQQLKKQCQFLQDCQKWQAFFIA